MVVVCSGGSRLRVTGGLVGVDRLRVTGGWVGGVGGVGRLRLARGSGEIGR